MAGCNKCYGGNNAEKVVLSVHKWFISQNRTLLLYAGFCPLLYFGAPSELPKKWLLCGYLSMSRFFPSTCCCTLIVNKCYRNVFLRKKRERELSFSLDKVQFRKCKKNSFEWYIFHFHHWYSWQLCERKKKDMSHETNL